jgi:hypothetical protein
MQYTDVIAMVNVAKMGRHGVSIVTPVDDLEKDKYLE